MNEQLKEIEEEFNQRFGFGIWDSRAKEGYRQGGIYSSEVLEFLKSKLAAEYARGLKDAPYGLNAASS